MVLFIVILALRSANILQQTIAELALSVVLANTFYTWINIYNIRTHIHIRYVNAIAPNEESESIEVAVLCCCYCYCHCYSYSGLVTVRECGR